MAEPEVPGFLVEVFIVVAFALLVVEASTVPTLVGAVTKVVPDVMALS